MLRACPLLSSGHVTSQLLVDKNTIVNAANVSHGVRLRKIDMRESDIFTNTYRWQASVTEKVRDPHAQGDGTQTGLAQAVGPLLGKTLPDFWSTLRYSRDPDKPLDSLLGFNLFRLSKTRSTGTVSMSKRSFSTLTVSRRSCITWRPWSRWNRSAVGRAAAIAGDTRTAPSSTPSGHGQLSLPQQQWTSQAKGILLPSHHKLQIKATY